MTPKLYQFFVSYRAWLDAGAPDGEPYMRSYGLCSNCLRSHLFQSNELKDLLYSEFGDAKYPFGKRQYYKDNHNKTQYLNHDRIAFVDRMIAEHAPKMEGVV